MSQKAKYLCRFTRELDEKLIELVSANEVLYDTGHKYYKDLNVRDDVWLAISSIVGRTVTDCKTRWRSLRDLYHRKKKDQRMGKKIRSPWEYMDSISFLEKFTTEKRALQDDPLEDQQDDENKIDIKLEFDADLPSTSTSENGTTSIEEPTPSKKQKLIKEEGHSFLHDNSAILHLLREIRDLAKTRENPIMTFFDSMAKTVVKFPPAQAAEVKLKVCQIVTEMECRILEETGNYPDNLETFE
ncbi:unnamed protein product [Ceutorhynchus assimilis]|uniref:MADF domain-containing protein n=1 Tax=Ceutorhynchus assimilis TaxID=467358 RepID=A0A9N9N0Q0_9CUCU|nr:unnamed protein product [Ceutorhynchus assimilis]